MLQIYLISVGPKKNDWPCCNSKGCCLSPRGHGFESGNSLPAVRTFDPSQYPAVAGASCIGLPFKDVTSRIDKMSRDFLGNNTEGRRKIHGLRWDNLTVRMFGHQEIWGNEQSIAGKMALEVHTRFWFSLTMDCKRKIWMWRRKLENEKTSGKKKEKNKAHGKEYCWTMKVFGRILPIRWEMAEESNFGHIVGF